MKPLNKLLALGFIICFFLSPIALIFPVNHNSPMEAQLEIDNPALSSATYLDVSDDFESYTNATELSASWTLFEGTGCSVNLTTEQAHSGTQAVKLVDNDNTAGLNAAIINQTFNIKTGYFYVSVYFYTLQTDGHVYLRVMDADANIAFDAGLGSTGYLFYASAGGWHTSGISYSANTWYHIEVKCNITSQSFSFYFDDQPVVENVPTLHSLNNVTQIYLRTSGTNGAGSDTHYVDDVLLRGLFVRLENIHNGTQVGEFYEELLFDDDGNSHVIQSEDVSGDQKIAVQYQYNFSEAPPESLERIEINYAYQPVGGYTPSGAKQIIKTNFDDWTDSENKLTNNEGELHLSLDGTTYNDPQSANMGWSNYVQSGSYSDTAGWDSTNWGTSSVTDWVNVWLKLRFPNPDTNRQYFGVGHACIAWWDGWCTNDYGHWEYSFDNSDFNLLCAMDNCQQWYYFWEPFYIIYSGSAIDESESALGGFWNSNHYQRLNRYQRDWFDDTVWWWDYAMVEYYWYQYHPTAQIISETYGLSDGTHDYKELHNITLNIANLPSGTSVGIEYDANTPNGWTGWQSTTNGGDIDEFAAEVKVRLTLNSDAAYKQKTPKITSLTINYGDPAPLNTTVSLYNYGNSMWDPVISSTQNDLDTQYGSNILYDNLTDYVDAGSILLARVEATIATSSFDFNIDQLLIDIGEPSYYLDIANHTELGMDVPPGVPQINSDLDFNVSITYGTRIGPNYKTYTNASILFRINEDPWQGPYSIGEGTYGNGTGRFTIGKDNYSTNDALYYYFHFQQYQSGTGIVVDHYWTQDGHKTDKVEAEDAAFQKKVGSILYELTLNYSIWYNAELKRVLSPEGANNITLYPWIKVAYDNISISFYNTTTAQTNFSVSCPEESKMNHYVADDTRNISKFDGPTFSLTDGLNSPFVLPIAQTWEEDVSTILVPVITYDGVDPGRNLTFRGDWMNLTYRGDEKWPYPHRTVLKFANYWDNASIRFDSYTGIMVHYYWLNETVNASQKVEIALIGNNQSYPINLWIEQRYETADFGFAFLNDTIFEIVHDPPGDHSYSMLQTGTTIRKGYTLGTSMAGGWFSETQVMVMGFGGGVDASMTWGSSTEYDAEWEWTLTRTLTSSMETEDPTQIGPGRGDLYYLVGLILQYWVKVNNFYIVIGGGLETPGNYADPADGHRNDIKVWTNGSFIEYGLSANSSKAVYGSQLADYNASHLAEENVFADNQITSAEASSVKLLDTLFWTPGGFVEYSFAHSSSLTKTHTVTFDFSLDTFFAFDHGLTMVLGLGVAKVEDIFSISGRVGVSFEFGSTTVSTTSTEQNQEILLHLEDNDGAPVGEHDQFLINIYEDKVYNTYGVTFDRNFTYTSRPYEIGTKDRRSPTISEIFGLNEYLSGTVAITAAANDEETGVSIVKFYYDNDPVFTEEDSIQIGFQESPINNTYMIPWDTTTFHGTYYLFAVTYDSADVKNYLISDKYMIQVDNLDPVICEIIAYAPYSGAIKLYSNVLDLDSGIYCVEYWIGPPGGPTSSYLGTSYDSSNAFQLTWATSLSGRDDGSHMIYARAYDRAGNYLDSAGLEITVDNDPALLTTDQVLLIALISIGSVGIGAYLLDTLHYRKKREVARQKRELLKKSGIISDKPPKGA